MKTVVPTPPGIYARKLHKEAQSYTKAARVLGREDPQEMIGPRYFLLSHGLELALKSFLAAHGADKKALKEIGHDLNEAYERARVKSDFPVSIKLLKKLVELMGPEHKEYWFRYPGAPYEELPDSNNCCDVIDELLDRISDIVKSADQAARRELVRQGLKYDPERLA